MDIGKPRKCDTINLIDFLLTHVKAERGRVDHEHFIRMEQGHGDGGNAAHRHGHVPQPQHAHLFTYNRYVHLNTVAKFRKRPL